MLSEVELLDKHLLRVVILVFTKVQCARVDSMQSES